MDNWQVSEVWQGSSASGPMGIQSIMTDRSRDINGEWNGKYSLVNTQEIGNV